MHIVKHLHVSLAIQNTLLIIVEAREWCITFSLELVEYAVRL